MKPLEQFSESGREALQLCEDILEMLGDLPERAAEFSESVEDKVLSIMKWAEIDSVTEAQLQALRNMQRGVEKWLG